MRHTARAVRKQIAAAIPTFSCMHAGHSHVSLLHYRIEIESQKFNPFENPSKGFGVRSLVCRTHGDVLFAIMMEGLAFREEEHALADGPRSLARAWQAPMLKGAC